MSSLAGNLEARFLQLLAKTKAELLCLNKPVDNVYRLLRTLSGKGFDRYVQKLRGRSSANLDELFDDLTAYCSNSLEYELLEAIIKRNNCSPSLRKKMEQYIYDVRNFKRTVSLSKFTIHKHHFLKRRSPLKCHKTLRTRHDINPDNHTLVYVDRLGQELKTYSKCYLQLYNVEIGSVILEWSVLKEQEYMLITFIVSGDISDMLKRYQIVDISIDDVHIDHSVRITNSNNVCTC